MAQSNKKNRKKVSNPRKPITKTKIKSLPKIRDSKKALPQKRIKEHPNDSLTLVDDLLYCQCCQCNVLQHKGSCAKHIKTPKHINNLKKWKLSNTASNSNKNQQGIQDAFSTQKNAKSMRQDSVLAAVISGIRGENICKYDKLMNSKYKFKNGSGLITSSSSLVNLCKLLFILSLFWVFI